MIAYHGLDSQPLCQFFFVTNKCRLYAAHTRRSNIFSELATVPIACPFPTLLPGSAPWALHPSSRAPSDGPPAKCHGPPDARDHSTYPRRRVMLTRSIRGSIAARHFSCNAHASLPLIQSRRVWPQGNASDQLASCFQLLYMRRYPIAAAHTPCLHSRRSSSLPLDQRSAASSKPCS